MPSAYDVYTFYLEPEHLRGTTAQVHIESVAAQPVWNPNLRRNENKLILRFHGKKLAMCLNKTQTAALIELAQTDDYSKWVGHTILLSPTTINNRNTITITAPPTKPDNAAAPTAAPEN